MSARRRAFLRALWTCAALAGAPHAQAANSRSDAVTVLLGPFDDEGTGEMLLRVQGELVADGFQVTSVRSHPELARQDLVHQQCTTLHATVVAGLFFDERAGEIEMIFCDPASQREAVQRAPERMPSASDPPEAVARHMVDHLRAALLDFAVETLRLAARPPDAGVPSATPPARGRSAGGVRGAIELGAGILAGFGGLDPSIVPLLRVRLGLGSSFQLRLTGAGLGTSPTVAEARGSATVSQAIGVAEAALTLAPSTWLRPLLVVGAGAYGARANGTGRAPYDGATSGGAAFAVDGGVGVAPSITSSLSIALEAHLVCAVPAMAVRFVDTDVARLGQPMFLVSLSFLEWI